MLNQHPITPPPELVDKLFMLDTSEEGRLIAAYRAGADQELEACCEWIPKKTPWDAEQLRAARRPKPPSLKEQALEQLDGIATCFRATHMGDLVCDKIRRALEALDD